MKTAKSKGLLLLAGFVAIGSLWYPRALMAQSQEPGALHLTTSPLPISLKAKPGNTVTTELRVRNSGTKTERLKVGLMKFTAFGEEGKPRLEERAPGDEYFDWVKFSQTEVTAPPNEWQSLTMTIALPKSAALGYYYAVTFSRANPSSADEGKTAVRGGTATLVLLEAEVPNAKRALSLQTFTAGKRTYEFLPATFHAKLQNTGNIHTAPSGTIFINRGKQQVATVSVNTTKGNLLPASSRIFTSEWGDGFPAYQRKEADGKVVLKDGQPVHELTWDSSKLRNLRIGKYTATLVMIYDDGTRDVPLEASVSFWVVPWRILIVALLVAVFVGVGVWSTTRKVLATLRKKKTTKGPA